MIRKIPWNNVYFDYTFRLLHRFKNLKTYKMKHKITDEENNKTKQN